jgi:glycosyltransferase involved in cell wall biosynthesis
MTKIKPELDFPFVSICTPTFNRRPFFPFLIKCFLHQSYPREKMEWIIIDDGTDHIRDLVKDIPQVKYYSFTDKFTLGKKRNLMHSKCKGDIIVYMDDDDYYPPERVSHAVSTLLDNPTYLIAGSSILYIYFNELNKIYQCGPYGHYHSTAATFAFRKELLNNTSYNNDKAIAEETFFLKNYTIPLKQLDPLKTILVFSHSHNSFDKRRLLETPKETRITETSYKANDFIKDIEIETFYTKNLHSLLDSYTPGQINLKPDVVKQISDLKESREKRKIKMIEENETKQKIINSLQQNPKTTQYTNIEELKEHYEQIISNKSYLINELLKKVKALTAELDNKSKK